MKAVAAVAAAAALLAGGVAANHNHRQAHHQGLFERRGHNESEVCVPSCTTIWKTITGEAGLYTPPPATATAYPTGPAVVPTPVPNICPTPGTYTFPATTLVVTETTTVCGASSTVVPSGTHTLGGVTTVVTTATTVVCPYATTSTQNGVVTSVLKTTTYVCPSAGTYTIAPVTTTVTGTKVTVVVPVVTTICPGTYTAPAVVTVVETATVVYCPFTSSEAPPPPPAPTAQFVPPSAPAPVKPKPDNSGGLGGSGGKWAMTYTPYRPDGDCKTPEEVNADVAKISAAGFKTLRVYSTDCDTLPNVGAAARANGLNLIIGVFIGKVGCDNEHPDVEKQVKDIKDWAQWDLVKLVVVANEALFNKFCSVAELRDLIKHVKSELGAKGYTGPYTTTDVVSAWKDNDVKEICDLIDVVACNSHAYFNAGTLPQDAGKFVAGQLAIVQEKCPKTGFIMETGWPTGGECNGVACPGVEQQRVAIASIKQEVGDIAVFFSFTDDPWKSPGHCKCEQHWGCGQLFSS